MEHTDMIKYFHCLFPERFSVLFFMSDFPLVFVDTDINFGMGKTPCRIICE